MSLAGKIVAVAVAIIVAFAFIEIGFSGKQDKPDASQTQKPKNVVEVASHTSRLSTFVVAVKSAGLARQLEEKNSYTIFVPTDKAFASLPGTRFQRMMKPQNKSELQEVINYHTVPRALTFDNLKDGMTLTTANGRKLKITISGDEMKVNGARVIQKSIPAANGVIYVIDKVLLPPSKVEK